MYLTSLRICQRYCLARRGCPTPTSVHTRLVGSTVSSSEAPAASPSGSGSGSDVYIDSAIPAPSPAPAADAGGTASSAIGTLAARMAAVGRPPVTARSESGELCEPAGFPRASMGTVADAHVGVVLPLSVRLGGMGGAALKAQCWALSLAIDRSAHVGGAMGGAAACARPRPHGGGLRHGVNQLAAPPFSNLWQWRPLRSMLPHAHRHRSGECRTQIS